MSYHSQEAARIGAHIYRMSPFTLSDEDCKTIEENTNLKELAQAIMEEGPPFSAEEIKVLVKAAGDMDEDHSFDRDGHRWRDDIVDKYADFIRNYEYTYNDKAHAVDPSIDTNEEHIGPMAQDIEQVNPACVKEDPQSGYKTVDTGRLALMNAGAIADLARRLQELENGGSQ